MRCTNLREILLSEVFPVLRSLGVVCRANFLCCGSCGASQLNSDLKERVRKGKNLVGAIWWSKQDESDLNQFNRRGHFKRKSEPFVYLHHSAFNLGKDETGEDDNVASDGLHESLGRLVTSVLERKGLQFEWDGSHMSRIKVMGLHPDILKRLETKQSIETKLSELDGTIERAKVEVEKAASLLQNSENLKATLKSQLSAMEQE